MDKSRFVALLPCISADLTDMIAKRNGLSDQDALQALYASKLYEMLEQEDTQVWYYSTEKLYELFHEEQVSGTITLPDV